MMEEKDTLILNTVFALAGGYKNYYEEWLATIKVESIELSFSVPLRNPNTGAISTACEIAGKIDKIIAINGETWIPDHKTTGRMPDRNFLKLSPQGDTYIIALKERGIEAKGLIWDYIRKPSIRMTQKETPETFKDRLIKDIADRPEFYFQQIQVQRWDSDIALTQLDVWQCHKNLMTCHRDGIWPRYTCACNNMYGTCPFLPLCADDNDLTRQGYQVRPAREFDSPEIGQSEKRRESNSSLNTFRTCPRLYYWKYIQNLETTERKEALYTGTLMHEALDFVYANKPLEEWFESKLNPSVSATTEQTEQEEF